MSNARGTNQETITRVWVLGAGASIDGSAASGRAAPSDYDFLRSLSSYFNDSPTKRKNSLLWNRVSKGFSITQSNWTEGSLEEGIRRRIARFDANRLFDRPRNSGKGKPTITNEAFLADLNEVIRWWLSGLKVNPRGSLSTIVESVLASGGTEKIITFNYDTLIEECFERRDVNVDEVLDLTRLQKGRGAKYFSPYLLKMHGSVNWASERAAYMDTLLSPRTPSKPDGLKFRVAAKRERLAESEIAVIVPPVPGKNVGQVRELATIWEKAFKYLSNAQEIVVFGYSCPETDDFARQMFSNLRATSSSELIRRQVSIINPKSEVLARFFDYVNNSPDWSDAQWRYYPNFSSYCRANPSKNS